MIFLLFLCLVVIIIYLPCERWHVAWGAVETQADVWIAFSWIPAEDPGCLTSLRVAEKHRNHDNCCSVVQNGGIQFLS